MEWFVIVLSILLILLLVGSFSSCKVVETNYSNGSIKEGTVYYYLPESVIKIKSVAKVAVIYNVDDSTINASSRLLEQSFSATTEMVADTKGLLTLNYKPNAMMSDEIKYGVNSKGLLETVNITTDDRIAEIISKLAEAPQIILASASGVPRADKTIIKIKEYTADFIIKASAISSSPTTINWNLIIPNELIEDVPLSISGSFKVSSNNNTSTGEQISQIIANGSSRSGGPNNQNDPIDSINSKKLKSLSVASSIDGILTRPLKNIEVEIESTANGIAKGLPLYLVVADNSKLINIPVNRTAFVKRTNKISIADGIILSNEINKPSSVEGFVSIPVNVAKSIVSIPGQLVTFRIDNTKRLADLEAQKLNLEKAIQENQKFGLTREQELEKLKLELQKNVMSNEVELKKLKIDLEKSLLESEKARLETFKQLEELKNEIEKLKSK